MGRPSMERFVHQAQRMGTTSVLCVVIWLVTGGYFWPVWVILATVLILGRQARRTFVARPSGRHRFD